MSGLQYLTECDFFTALSAVVAILKSTLIVSSNLDLLATSAAPPLTMAVSFSALVVAKVQITSSQETLATLPTEHCTAS